MQLGQLSTTDTNEAHHEKNIEEYSVSKLPWTFHRKCAYSKRKMSRRIRKPIISLCENKGAGQLRGLKRQASR